MALKSIITIVYKLLTDYFPVTSLFYTRITKKQALRKFASLLVACLSIGYLITANAAENSSSSSVSALFTAEDSSENFLPPDEAFKLNLNAVDATTLQGDFTVVPGYYLYRQRIKFEIPKGDTSAKIA